MDITLHLDAHAHLYPFQDAGLLFESALRHMPRRAPADVRALLLAERSDCHVFRDLAADEWAPPAGWSVSAYDPEGAVRLHHAGDGKLLWLVAGRQHATAERLEICSMFADPEIPDGLPAEETLRLVLETPGAVAGLNWAPGKWLGKRGKIVRKLLEDTAPERLWLVDTSLRARGIPEPGVFAAARREGRPLLAGSDPLPVEGEERVAGCYFAKIPLTLGEAAGEEEDALDSPDSDALVVGPLKAALARRPLPEIRLAGERNGLLELAGRLRAHGKAGKRAR